MLLILCVALFINVIIAGDLEVGDNCIPNRDISTGKCSLVTECEEAIRYIRQLERHPYQRCGFVGSIEVVCCPMKRPRPTTIQDPVDRYDPGASEKIAEKQCTKIVSLSIPPLNTHIINGEESQQGEFPHMAALAYLRGDTYQFDCGGSLISEYYVLTAAHCVDNIEQVSPEFVRLGVVDLGEPTFNPDTDIRIDGAPIIYPSRTTATKYHDLCLLRLAKPAEYSFTVTPACLYTKETVPNKPLTISGWGRFDIDRDAKSNVLLKANVTVVPNSDCKNYYSNWRKLPAGIGDGQFCAADPNRRTDACQGDSGGPIQALTSPDGHYRLIGITSFGRGCGGVPGIYTKIFPYLQWIESVVWPNGA